MAAKSKARKAEGPPSQRLKKHRKTNEAIKQPVVASRIESLPTEVIFMIAHSLPSATDITRLARTSKTMTSVLNDADKSFWWQYFSSMFDKHDSAPSASDFARQSRIYQYLMKELIFQDDGHRGPWGDVRTFTAMKLLINEAYSHGKQQSANIDTMTTLVKKQNLFGNLFRPPYYQTSIGSRAKFLGPALLTMLHIGLDVWTPDLPDSVCSFAESKAAAYHHPNMYPLFIHPEPDNSHLMIPGMRPHATTLLLIANFFRFYFRDNGSCGEAAQIYSGLPVKWRPSPWSHHLQSDVNPLVGTTHWKGCTAYMNHNSQKRWRAGGGKVDDNRFMTEPDEFDEETLRALGFLDLRLDFLEEGRRYWHNDFREQVRLCWQFTAHQRDDHGVWTYKPDKYNAAFIGFSRSATNEIVNGNIHPLGETAGIQGFKRISWISAAAQHTSIASSTTKLLAEVNECASAGVKAYAYEGVVLPGGNIMIGRWWNANAHPGYYRSSIPSHANGQPPYVPRSHADLETAPDWNLKREYAATCDLETGPFIYWRVKDGPAEGVGSK